MLCFPLNAPRHHGFGPNVPSESYGTNGGENGHLCKLFEYEKAFNEIGIWSLIPA